MSEENYDLPCCPAEKTIKKEKYEACVSALTEALNEALDIIKEYGDKNLAPSDWELRAKLVDKLFEVCGELERKLCEREVPPSPEDAKKEMLITLAEMCEKEAKRKASLKTRLRYLFEPEERKRGRLLSNFYRAVAQELYRRAEALS
jgi:hypothetical protein